MADASRTLTAKFDGDVTGLASAAKRGERIVEKFGDSSATKFGTGFDNGFKRWIGGDGGKAFGDAGRTGGTVFGSGLLGALRTPILGPVLIAAFLAALAIAMPIIGSAAAGLFILAFGAGLATLGLVFAAQSEKVKAEFRALGAYLKSRMQLISQPFEATLRRIAASFRRTFDGLQVALGLSFLAMSEPIADFADKVSEALLELEPVIGPVTEAFNALLKSIGDRLPGLFRELGVNINKVAESIKKNPDTFTQLIAWLFLLFDLVLLLVASLNDLAGEFPGLMTAFKIFTLGPLALLIGGVIAATKVIQFLKSAWDKVKSVFSRNHKANITATAKVFWDVLGKVLSAAGKWALSTFKAAITATGQSVFTVLGKAYEAAGRWVRSFFLAKFGVDISAVWRGLQDALEVAKRWAGKVFSATFSAKSIVGLLPGLAHGGAAMPGRSYLVGERGPEILTMGAGGGVVTPNHELGTGGDVSVFITIDGQQLQGRIDRTVRSRDRGVKRALSAGALRGAPA